MSGIKDLLNFTGPVVFEIGTRRYELAFSYRAIQRFEAAVRPEEDAAARIGFPEFANSLNVGRAPSFSDLVKAFWAAAKSKNAVWTLEMADALFENAGQREYNALLDAVFKVIFRDYADPEFVERCRQRLENAEGEQSGEERPLGDAKSAASSSTSAE